MGGNVSKTAGKEEAAVEKPGEAAAVAAKANGQVICLFSREHFAAFRLVFCNVLRQWRAPCSL